MPIGMDKIIPSANRAIRRAPVEEEQFKFGAKQQAQLGGDLGAFEKICSKIHHSNR